MNRSRNHFGCLALLALILSGCYSQPTAARRATSFAPFAHTSVDGVELLPYLGARTVLVVDGTTPEAREGKLLIQRVRGGSAGMSVAIADDGYFLTAAHCVGHVPIYLCAPSGQEWSVAEARVVWAGHPYRGGARSWKEAAAVAAQDIAIVYAPQAARPALPWAEDAQLQPGLAVAAVGFLGPVGGHLLEVITPKPGQATQVVAHDLPVVPGHSGGPLVNRQGQLLGINNVVFMNALGQRKAMAVRPPRAWVEALIQSDRNRRLSPP